MGSTGAAAGLARSVFIGTSPSDGLLDFRMYIQDASDSLGRKRSLTVRPWSTVKDVKDQIFRLMSVPPCSQRLFLKGPLQNFGVELSNHWTLNDAGITEPGLTLTLDVRNGSSAYVKKASICGDSNNPESRAIHQYLSEISPQQRPTDVRLADSMKTTTPKALLQSIQRSRRGFGMGFKPELVLEGSGGTYFLHDSRKNKNGVFKPSDEEPYAENNPRGYTNTNASFNVSSDLMFEDNNLSLRAGVKPGESCVREVAAFALDHGGFCSVPMTTLVVSRHPAFHNAGTRLKVYEGGAGFGSHSLSTSTTNLLSSPTPSYGFVAESPVSGRLSNAMVPPQLDSAENQYQSKIGSYQEFVRSECTMDDLSPSMISVEEVQKIALLDIRLLNADRNAGNLLVKRNQDNSLTLVPIDHGYSLRSVCDICNIDWCWLEWRQTKALVTENVKNYILNLNIEEDVNILKKQFDIGDKALDYFRAATKMLQVGISAGLTLYEVANLVCRHDFEGEEPSHLEMLVTQASDYAISAIENGRWHHSAASTALANKLEVWTVAPPVPFPMKSNGMLRSTSSSEFMHHSRDLSQISMNSKKSSPPASANTSCSDSGESIADGLSDGEEGDDNDDCCEDWAAAVVADVSMEVSNLDISRKRMDSTDSSASGGSSSLSVQGFWTTRPGSFAQEAEESSFGCDSDLSRADDSFPQPKKTAIVEDVRKNSAPSSPEDEFDRISHSTTADSPQRLRATENAFSDMTVGLQPKHKAIKRSQSYSVFSVVEQDTSSKLQSASKAVMGRRGMTGHRDQGQHRNYTLKFIDLLIEREIRAACKRKIMDLYS